MTSIPETVKAHPNASTATGLGGVGVFVVWLLGHLHVSLGAEDATVISVAITSLGLFIGRSGVKGLFKAIWRGGQQ